MSFGSSTSVSKSSFTKGGEQLIHYFAENEDKIFEVSGFIYYYLNVNGFTESIHHLYNTPSKNFADVVNKINPFSLMLLGIHNLTEGSVKKMLGVENQHWYVLLIDDGVPMKFEFNVDGIKYYRYAPIGKGEYRLDFRSKRYVKGRELAQIVKEWTPKNYDPKKCNCHCFVRHFCERFPNSRM